jgi:hypothetical protein
VPGTRFRHSGMAAMTVDPQWTVAQTCVVLWGGNPTAVRERARARKVSAELVLYGCQRALDAQRYYGDDLAPFEQWDATPPGCLDVRVFDQDQIWVDALRAPHLITDRNDMTDDYLRALVTFLTDHAEHMLRGYLRCYPIVESDPRDWLESTSLMRGLRAEIGRRST